MRDNPPKVSQSPMIKKAKTEVLEFQFSTSLRKRQKTMVESPPKKFKALPMPDFTRCGVTLGLNFLAKPKDLTKFQEFSF